MPQGNVYYAEVVFNHIYKVGPDGTVSQVDTDTEMTMGLVMGPDGLLYGCRNRGGKIVRYSAAGQLEVLLEGELTPLPANPKAPGEFCNDMAINAEGGIWFTDRINRRVMYLSPERELRVVAEGFRPNGIVLSADRKTIAVTDSNEPVLHAFAVGEAGALTEIDGFFEPIKVVVQEGTDIVQPGTNGMTVDSNGHYYLASFYGIQVFRFGRALRRCYPAAQRVQFQPDLWRARLPVAVCHRPERGVPAKNAAPWSGWP